MVSAFGALITNQYINESFPQAKINDYPGNTWGAYVAASLLTVSGAFVDAICRTGSPSPPPIYVAPPGALGTTLIDHANQLWFVGSATIGQGVQVQSDTIQRYQDHGAHTNVLSPVPVR